MLNLLISILGDKYDLFKVEKRIYDLKEKIDFALEVQRTLFWKNELNNPNIFIYSQKNLQMRMKI